MSRARDLADLANNAGGLETLTVSDITDLSVSASNINSTTNQITDSSTDLNVDSNTLVVDKSANAVGIGTTAPEHVFHIADVGANSFNTKAVFDLEGTRKTGYTQAALELAPASSGGTFRPYAIVSELIASQASAELVFYDNTTERMRINSNGSLRFDGGLRKEYFAGTVFGNASVSHEITVNSSNAFRVVCLYTHHGISNYGCYLDAIYGHYAGHGGLQSSHELHRLDSAGGGNFSVTRSGTGPIYVNKNAGNYAGSGYYTIEVTSGMG